MAKLLILSVHMIIPVNTAVFYLHIKSRQATGKPLNFKQFLVLYFGFHSAAHTWIFITEEAQKSKATGYDCRLQSTTHQLMLDDSDRSCFIKYTTQGRIVTFSIRHSRDINEICDSCCFATGVCLRLIASPTVGFLISCICTSSANLHRNLSSGLWLTCPDCLRVSRTQNIIIFF